MQEQFGTFIEISRDDPRVFENEGRDGLNPHILY
jgi:hypothetical protein